MCGSMVDIQSSTAENRQGKKGDRKKKPQDQNIMACPIPLHGHKKVLNVNKHKNLEMWANAQRDGRPAEYRRRPLFKAAKFG